MEQGSAWVSIQARKSVTGVLESAPGQFSAMSSGTKVSGIKVMSHLS